MANQKVKCRQCGKQVDKSLAIEIKPRQYVCSQQCADDYRLAHEKQKSQNKPLSDIRRLTDYVQSYAPNTNWTALITYAKKLCRDSNMTIPGITYCLWYMREIAEVGFDGDGIRLVPYYYDMSKNWYKWRQDMRRQMAGWKPDDKEQEIVKLDVEKDVFA